MERRQKIVDWLRAHGNPKAESLLNSLNQMNLDEWEQKYRKELRKLEGYVDYEKSNVPLRDRARGEFDSYTDNPEWYIAGKAAKLGTNVEDLKKTLIELQKEKEYFEGRERRKKNVQNDFKWKFASDWAKQRYIDTPEKSYWANPELSVEHIPDIADAAVGNIAGLADIFLPKGVGTVVGPVLRGGRNLAQGQSVGDALTNFGADVAVNGSVDFLPTLILNKIGKVSKRSMGEVANYAQKSSQLNTADESIKEAKRILGNTDPWKLTSKGFDEAELAIMRNKFDALPDGPVKNDIMKILNSNPDQLIHANLNKVRPKSYEGEMVEVSGIGDASTNFGRVKNYLDVADAEMKQAKKVSDKNFSVYNQNGTRKTGTTELENAILEKKALGKGMSKTNKALAKGVQLATGQLGSGAVKTYDTSKGTRNPIKGETDRAEIDWYKTNYARDWNMGFKPKGNANDPIMKAYNEWLAEQPQIPTIQSVFQ